MEAAMEDDDGMRVMDSDGSVHKITFSNVTTAFTISYPIALKDLVRRGLNTRYVPIKNMALINLRTPIKVSASVWASGKVLCKAGSPTREDAISNSMAVAKLIQNLGFKVEMRNLRVVNVMWVVQIADGIDIYKLVNDFAEIDFVPEIKPYATWKMNKAELKIYHTGKIGVTARSEDLALAAVENFLNNACHAFRKECKTN